ncbi:hypothetical protein DPMN_119756 [Dreissena polymorpha]|uniref:Uncharacterized protein n=1 Tax=Dreissena polymorpha TaxID=45954 RepID=A0A9D4GMX9_DREPO|nr:hypothetical protein DPMN_119756 [Dreissena polymorpha]
MTEELQTPWTLSATSDHNSTMQDFTDLTDTTRHRVALMCNMKSEFNARDSVIQ